MNDSTLLETERTTQFRMTDSIPLEELTQCDSTRLGNLTQFTYSTLLEELTQFPVKDVLLLVLKYVHIPILPTSKLQEIIQFFKMLFDFDKPIQFDWHGYAFVHVYNVLPACSVHLFSLPSQPENFKYLFDIESYTEFLFYCTDVYPDTACVTTFAIFYMKTHGYLCVQMEKEFRGAGYCVSKVVFGLYLCMDLDKLLSYQNLSDRFYGTMKPNSKEHIPNVYFSNADAQTKELAFWSSSHFCFQ